MYIDGQKKVELQDRISLYLDHQMTSDEESEFAKNVSENPEIKKWVETEKKFKTLLVNGILRPSVSDELIKKIHDNLQVYQTYSPEKN